MDPFAIALILFLGGSFLTTWFVNSLGARLESRVQTLSHNWMQWPQRVMMYSGFALFFLLGFNYYYSATYGKTIFDILEKIPFLREISQSLRWFFGKIGEEFGAFFSFLPQEMPFLTILFVVFFAFLFLTIFNIKGLQRLLILLFIGGLVYLLMEITPFDSNNQQVNQPKKYERPAWATD